MDRYDLAIIGAGAAGEAAAFLARKRGASVAVIDRDLFGGSCPFCALAQVYARYGVPVTLVDSNPRILARDHERSSAVLARVLQREGVTIRTGVQAINAQAEGGDAGRHLVTLDDGSTAEGAAVLLAIGRVYPVAELGLDTVGADTSEGRLHPDEKLRIAKDVYAAGDPAGPEMHTHLSHYEGEMAVRIALGDDVTPDLRAIPRATYTEPETASVGLQVEEAREQGLDAEELTQDLATTSKGYVAEAEGHITIVVDRGSGTLLGAFAAGPAVSEMIHEAVLAVKLRTPLSVLADTLHAFPTAARVMGTLFTEAAAG